MGDNSPDPRAQDELGSTARPEPASQKVSEGVKVPEEDTAESDGDVRSEPRDVVRATRIVQAASQQLRVSQLSPLYVDDARMLVGYVESLEEEIKILKRRLGASGGNDSHNNADENNKPILAIKRQIKVRGGRYDTRWLEDHGEDSFAMDYSNDNEEDQPLTRRRVFNKAGLHLNTSLMVHSQVLVEMLKEIIIPCCTKDYEILFAQKVKIRQPYVVLFQNRTRLQKALVNETDDQKRSLLGLLLEFMEKERSNTWKKLDEIEAGSCEEVSFEDAWLLYAPGTTIFARSSKSWEAHKVQGIEVKHLPKLESLLIKAYSLDFDGSGTKLTPFDETLKLTPFTGKRRLSNLEYIPGAYLPDKDTICKDARARGKAFWEFNSHPAYRQYVGSAWPTTLASDHVRVIIDYSTPSRIGILEEDDQDDSSPASDDGKHLDCILCAWKYGRLAPYPPEELDRGKICPLDRWSNIPGTVTNDMEPQLDPEEVFIFCPSRVWAFSLKHKSWKRVEVHRLSPVVCAKDPFEKLVMSDQYKLVVESMVDSHLGKSIFSDIVRDKGRGLVVLLHGGPGTGKTLTAECVAEKKMRPLYMVTCGDLGTNPDEMERRLQQTFLYAVNWNAILLLDEADVFLQERDLQDLHRNALVSIFLRHIEYYDGLLFLTTNRPGQIDEAFQSRIHITLGLPDLNFSLQKQVWLIFIRMLKFEGSDKETTRAKKLKLLSFVESELESLLEKAGYHMNGRQIRNCISAASAIARKHGRDLQAEDITRVIELGAQFKDYMQKVNRMTQDEKARALGLRLLQKD